MVAMATSHSLLVAMATIHSHYFTCNTPFCHCNCCVTSCKRSRRTLYFLQRCETSCLRITSPALCNLEGFLFDIVALQVARKIASCNMSLTFTHLGENLQDHLEVFLKSVQRSSFFHDLMTLWRQTVKRRHFTHHLHFTIVFKSQNITEINECKMKGESWLHV